MTTDSGKRYLVQYHHMGAWVPFTVKARDIYTAFDLARDMLGPIVGICVDQTEDDEL